MQNTKQITKEEQDKNMEKQNFSWSEINEALYRELKYPAPKILDILSALNKVKRGG